MPKRQCPFDYNLLPQLKVRMDQKHYDSKHDSSMAKVHDKTLRMLFNGAKKLSKLNRQQSSVAVPAQSTQNNSEFCTHCNDLNVTECQCYFCDKWICKSCSATCFACHENFCSTHFIKSFVDGDGECVCLNCAACKSRH